MAIKWNGTSTVTGVKYRNGDITYPDVKAIQYNGSAAWSKPITVKVRSVVLGCINCSAATGTNSEPSPTNNSGARGELVAGYTGDYMQAYYGDVLTLSTDHEDIGGYSWTLSSFTVQFYSGDSPVGRAVNITNGQDFILQNSSSTGTSSNQLYDNLQISATWSRTVLYYHYYASTDYSGATAYVGTGTIASAQASGAQYSWWSPPVCSMIKVPYSNITSGGYLGSGEYLGKSGSYRWWRSSSSVTTERNSDYTFPTHTVAYYTVTSNGTLRVNTSNIYDAQTICRIPASYTEPHTWCVSSSSSIPISGVNTPISEEWFLMSATGTIKIKFGSYTFEIYIGSYYRSDYYYYTASVISVSPSVPTLSGSTSIKFIAMS